MGKGGGGGGPQQNTNYTTNIPEYAKPFVMNMLNSAQSQIYNDDMSTFRGYKPYSNDPTNYFAGPSGLQQSTYGEAGQMQTPGQFNLATGMGGIAGMGQMNAGRQFAQQATDPYAVQQYMSPYMQNVVDTQKSGAIRDFQIGQTARQGQQTRQGAFGGSRGAIENAEAQRNLMSQMQGIQATGTQKAFEDAQRQQQFGANLGLQGLQGASQTAGMLGQLGGAQQQADLARMGFQNQLGQQQQQYQQGIINQAVQDYATQQQYPMIQLSNMSNLLRGLPMQAGSTQMYQAAPNALSQLGGLGATALGVYGASGGFRAAQGGEVKSYAEGGEVASYAPGGVVGGVEAQLMQMDIPQLTQIAKTSPSVSIRQKAAEIIAQKQATAQTKQSMGLEGAPAGNLDDLGMAGGGIVAFSGTAGSYVDPDEPRKRRQTEMWERVRPDNKPYLAEDFREDAARFLNPIKDFLTMRGPRDLEKAKQLQTADQPGDFPMYTPKPVVGSGAVDNVVTNQNNYGGDKDTGSTKNISGARGDAGGKYEKEIEARLAEVNKGLGGGLAQKDVDALREEMKGNRDQNLWMSLIQGGAKAMQSASPHAMVGLGAGLEAGAKEYGRGMEAERADKKLLIAQQSALEQAEYARKTGNLNALIAAQTRLDAIKMQRENLGASKETAILSAREKARGEMIQRLMYQNSMDEDTATGIANRAYPSTIGTATAASEAIPKGVIVRKKG
jgi:hypothetical protein